MNAAPDLIRHMRKSPYQSILLKLIGTKSNRDGIGAKVRVVSGNLVQFDEVRSGGSYLSSNDLRLHFGLGTAKKVDRIEIVWPSGQKDTVENEAVGRILTITEGKGITETKEFRKATPTGKQNVKSKG